MNKKMKSEGGGMTRGSKRLHVNERLPTAFGEFARDAKSVHFRVHLTGNTGTLFMC